MTAVNRCPPDTHHDEAEEQNQPFAAATHQGVGCSYHHIGGMERWYRSKDIGVSAIDSFKDGATQHLVEATQSGHIAWCTQLRLEAVVHGIPRWSRRMDVVTGKAQQID